MNKKILEEIKKQIEIYNQNYPESSIMIIPQCRDTKDLFICLYNENQIDLFEKKDYHTPIVESKSIDHCFQSGSIYIGQNSKEICIKTDHSGWFALSHMEQAGFMAFCEGKAYIATSDLKDTISFENLRLLMHQQGRIESYIPGRATHRDIIDVLNYAQEIYFKKTYTKRR